MSNVLRTTNKKLYTSLENKSTSLNSSINISTEVINFQNDDFGIKLEETITVIQNKLFEQKEKSSLFNKVKVSIKPETDILTKLIFDRLGLKVRFIINDFFLPAAIMPFYLNENHIFLKDLYKEGYIHTDSSHKDIFNKIKKKPIVEGTVNVEKAKVGGIFSEYENDLFMNFENLILSNNLTPQEVTAVLLHELGHGFYACEYSNRLEENNQILINSLEQLFTKKDKSDLTYVYKEIKKVNDKVSESDIDGLVNGERLIPGLKLFKIISGTVTSQLTNKKYNETSFEQLADNFSSRFGYNKPLVSALQKLTGYTPFLAYLILFLKTYEQARVLFLLLFVISSPMAVFLKILQSIYFLLLIGYIFYYEGEGGKDYTYDNLKIRYKRIRNDLVERLKSEKISKESNNYIINNIKELDNIILNTPVPETIFKKIIDYVIPFNSKAKASISEQQLMEDLVANDLFIKSQQLKNI